MQRKILSLWALLLLAACGAGGGSSSSNGVTVPGQGSGDNPVSAQCRQDMLSPEQIIAVTRTPPDAPLADLSHYQARNAPRAPGAALNDGTCRDNSSFRYAVGVGDITGPIGANMAGYVDTDQISTGILDRQHARAFLFQSTCGGQDARAVIVQMDIGLMFHAIRQGVIDALDADPVLSAFYGDQNVMLNASHSHSTAAGQSHFDAFHVLTLGHDIQAYDAAVSGVVASIRQSHQNLQHATPGPIRFNQGELLNGNVQRSMPAFLNNPESERRAFIDTRGEPVTTNRMMTLLRLQRDDGTPVGMLNWYAIHGTSIWQINTLLSGDNKGYAAYRFEQDFDTDYFADEPFLAGFMQADEGDASPNLFIPELSEAELRDLMSDGFRNRGGGRTEPENALISGFKQYRRARDLYENASERLTGQVAAGSIFIDFSSVQVNSPRDYPPELQPVQGQGFATCSSALGVSFGGGAEDGRGPTAEGQTCADITDIDALATLLTNSFETAATGTIPPGLIVPVGCDNPVYDALGYACHAEKPIIFPLAQPSPFLPTQTLEPQTLKIQIIVLGNLAVIGLPWEVTTMSGRRIRTAVLDALQGAGVDYAVISGLTNGFVHYLTTREEYASQQYEGASTVFGPWAQEAVQQESVRLASHLRDGTPITSPFADPDFRSQRSALLNPMLRNDGLPTGSFGQVVQQPRAQYQLGGGERLVVTARFIGGHPRNDLRQGSSYLFVERLDDAGNWQVVQTDSDWFTRFEYQQLQADGSNHAVINWIVPAGTAPGIYRIRHEGASLTGAYSGTSRTFELLSCDS